MIPPAAAVTVPHPHEPGWSDELVLWTTELGIVLVILGMVFCILRLIRGPHLADRALAVDTLAIQLIALVVLFTIRSGTLFFFDGILTLSLLGFAGTVAMSQFILRRRLRGDAPPAAKEVD